MELPETLIHLIQSFLTGKEAARTTLLSKSWRSAWSTRPAIDLVESHFPRHYDTAERIDGLTEFAKKTFRRYEESNLSIDTFSLCLRNEWYASFGLAAEWTLKALKLGATDLTLRMNFSGIDIPLNDVFGSKNVVRLCLRGFKINQLKVIKCTRLKSLTLSALPLNTDRFLDIISCFPLIEYLSLSEIKCSDEDRVVRPARPPTIILHRLRSLVLSKFKSQFQMKTLFLDDLSTKLPNLKDLTLELVVRKQHYDQTSEVIRNISSCTIETLNIRYVDNHRYLINGQRERVAGVRLDVPSIHKFTFEGSYMPNLRFSPTPGDSHVSITNHGDLSTTWFCKLSEFLTKLKGSKIHLCLHLNFKDRIDYEVGETDGSNVFEVDDWIMSTAWFRELSNLLTKLRGSKIHLGLHLQSYFSSDYDVRELDGLNVCEVDDLTLDIKDLSSLTAFHALLDGLFRICRPKTITQYASPPNKKDDVNYDRGGGNTARNNDLFICRTLERAMQARSSLISTQFMYRIRDLEELDAQQLFDEVWQPQPLSSILDDSSTCDQKRRFRLQLKWKPSSCLKQHTRPSDDDDDDDHDAKRFKYVI